MGGCQAGCCFWITGFDRGFETLDRRILRLLDQRYGEKPKVGHRITITVRYTK